jgi:hypothetical protein
VGELRSTDFVRRGVMDCRDFSSQSSLSGSAFLIGQDGRGNWVARDQNGLRGGLFVSCADAVRFAELANIHQPQDIIMVPGTLELDLEDRSGASDATATSNPSDTALQWRAA